MDAHELFSLRGKKAIITGASRGIGKAAAEIYNQCGAECALIARSEEVVRVAEALSASGVEAHAVRADLSVREQRRVAFDEALRQLGTVDILVNNAGAASACPALKFPLEQWDRELELNLTCAFELCQLAGKIMFLKRGGKIINVCSLHSFLGRKSIEAYAASKGGLALLTKSLAQEWSKYGVCVNGIAPGFIETDISAVTRNNPGDYQKSLDRLPMGRWGRPDDLKGAFVFLASKASDYVTGHILVVDGGIMAG